MFERFTEEARQVVVLAQEEARGLGHNYIGTEHILLGLLAQPETIAGRELIAAGVTRDEARTRIIEIVSSQQAPPAAQIPFTPRAKKVLELSLREALTLGHDFIDTFHVLLGLLREHEGVAMRVLHDAGVREAALRQCIHAAAPPRGTGSGPPSPSGAGPGFAVRPDQPARRILMRAGARALNDGREEYTVEDVMWALGLSVDPEAGAPE